MIAEAHVLHEPNPQIDDDHFSKQLEIPGESCGDGANAHQDNMWHLNKEIEAALASSIGRGHEQKACLYFRMTRGRIIRYADGLQCIPKFFDLVPETAQDAGYSVSCHRRGLQFCKVLDGTRKHIKSVETFLNNV